MTTRWQQAIRHDGDVGIKAIELLADNIELSRTQIKRVMQNGAVWCEDQHGVNRIRRASKNIKPGSALHVYYDAEIQAQEVTDAQLIADEGDYSVWNKPAGMFSQGSKWGDHCTIYRYAEIHLNPERPAFLVHRLDRATNGLMVLAHTKKAARQLSELFRERKVTKRYRAIVAGEMSDLELPHEISTLLDDKPAQTIILKKQERSGGKSALDIEIKTGRKHQIRRHLSEAGLAVVGDRLYGDENNDVDLQLSSVFLEFISPFDDLLKSYSLNT